MTQDQDGEAATQTPPPLEITLFGAFAVRGANGNPLKGLRERKAWLLLAQLVLARGRDVRRVELADHLWPQTQEKEQRANLRQSLACLRRVLGGRGATHERVRGKDALSLNLSNVSADVLAFESAVKRGEGDPANAVGALKEAVDQYTGPFLPDCQDGWAQSARDEYERQYMAVLDHLATHALDRFAYEEAEAYARKALETNPYSEAAQCALIAAIAKGKNDEALVKTRQDLLRRLNPEEAAQDETGLEPEAERLYQQFHEVALKQARNRPKAQPRPADQFSPPDSTLPDLSATRLVNREIEIPALKHDLRRAKLVTLTGEGGIGKTRLAVQAASEMVDEYRHGVRFVDLGSLPRSALAPANPSSVTLVSTVVAVQPLARYVAHELKAPERPDQTPTQSLLAHLRHRSLLLVLDTCEHVAEPCAQMVDELLHGCDRLRVLATSQHELNVAAEKVVRVEPLPPPPVEGKVDPYYLERVLENHAVQLFCDRARLADEKFVPDSDNVLAIVHVCRRLDGMPLALELAAAQIGALSVEEIARGLDEQFDQIAAAVTQNASDPTPDEEYPFDLLGSRRGGTARQRTLRAAMDWSYGLLAAEPRERRLLNRLSVFPGSWTLEAAQAVCADDGLLATAVRSLLPRLVEKSLVQSDARKQRYRLLETVRLYVRSQWRSGDSEQSVALPENQEGQREEQIVRAKHGAWCLAFAQANEPENPGPEQGRRMNCLEAEYDNLRSALTWSITENNDPEGGLRLAGCLWKFWEVRGRAGEGWGWFKAAWERTHGAEPTMERARALNGGAVLGIGWHAQDELIEVLLAEAEVIFEQHGDAFGVACATNTRAYLARLRNHNDEATRLYTKAAQVFEDAQDPYRLALAWRDLAHIAAQQGDDLRARDLFERSVAVFRRLGYRDNGLAWALTPLGGMARQSGHKAQAVAHYEECLRLFEGLNDPGGTSEINHRLALFALEREDTLSAEQYLRRSITAGRDTGNKTIYVWPTLHLIRLLAGKPDLPAARLLLTEAHTTFDELALDPTSDPGIAQTFAELDQIVAVPDNLDQNTPR